MEHMVIGEEMMLNKQLFQTFCVWSAEAIVQRHERLALKMLRRIAGRVVYSAMQTWKLYLQCRQDKAHKQLKAKTMLARLEGHRPARGGRWRGARCRR